MLNINLKKNIIIIFLVNLIFIQVGFAKNPQDLSIDDIYDQLENNITQPLKLPVVMGYNTTGALISTMINNQGPYVFLLDTGAEHNYLTKSVIEKLKLPLVTELDATIYTATSKIKTSQKFYNIESLKIKSAEFKNLPIVEIKDEDAPGQFIAGLIGINSFKDLILTLNFGKESIILDNNSNLNFKPGTAKNIIPTLTGDKNNTNLPVLLATINYKHFEEPQYIKLLIDSGHEGLLYLNLCHDPNESDAVLRKKFDKIESLTFYDLYGNPKEHEFANLLGNLSFGDVVIKNPLVTHSKIDCSQHSRVYSLLGVHFLTKHKVTIDTKGKVVIID